jgi:hypothetical protein
VGKGPHRWKSRRAGKRALRYLLPAADISMMPTSKYHFEPASCILWPPDQWPWSSFRFYYLNDSSVLTMDQLA